jgi:hypothetical protein
MSETAVAALGIALLVLLGGIAIPAVIDDTNSSISVTETVSEGETTRLGTNLALRANNVSNDTVDVTAIARDTGNTTTERLNVSNPVLNQQNVTLDNETIQMEVTRIENRNASISIVYPGTFGYSEGVLTIRDSLPIILVSMLFISIMAFVGRIQ